MAKSLSTKALDEFNGVVKPKRIVTHPRRTARQRRAIERQRTARNSELSAQQREHNRGHHGKCESHPTLDEAMALEV